MQEPHHTVLGTAAAATASERFWSAVRSPLGALYIALLAAALALGLFARLHHLGQRQLAVDEYYFTYSVDLIVETGVPALPGGGYYMRGLLPQYITAASVWVFGKTGFAYRLPAVLFGLVSVGLAYVYARRFVEVRLAGLLTLWLLLSSWHVEFSRFARMYTAFQCVTLLFLLSVDSAFFRGNWRWRYLPHVAAAMAAFTHQLSVLLLPFLFLPLIVAQKRFPTLWHRCRYAVVSLITSLLCLAFTRTDWRNVGVSDAWPEQYVRWSASKLRLPAFPFWRISPDPLVNLAFVLGMCALTILVWWGLTRWRRKSGREGIAASDVVLAVLLLCTALHAFILSAACLLLLVFRYEMHRWPVWPKRVRWLLGLTVVSGVTWVGYAVLTQAWMAHADVAGHGVFGALRQAFFGWPDLYGGLLRLWIREFPWLSIAVVSALAYQLLSTLRLPAPLLLRRPAVSVLYFVLCLAVLNTLYPSTRYAFFFYPLVLLVLLQSLPDVSTALSLSRTRYGQALNAWAPVGLGLAIFMMTSDWNPSHLTQVTAPEVNFRVGRFSAFADTWYPRIDFASPARFLDGPAAVAAAAPTVVLGQPPVSYHLRRDHAVYYAQQDARFFNVSRQRGQRDLWSGQRLLSTPEDLRHYTRDSQTVWLVRSVATRRHPFRMADVWPQRLRHWEQAFVSEDAHLEVVRVTLGAASR
ncbi:MAG: glycosyltransferase family 39 protein [Candidatus Tectomicrobia bacterium]|nr:glycosyltransferase family 39 protein [Candidatus Tectomicrobia bacterium]